MGFFGTGKRGARHNGALKAPDLSNGFYLALERIRTSPEYRRGTTSRAPYGIFKERPIIGEFTPINGGIYISPYPAEAVVVDEEYGRLEQIYQDFIRVCVEMTPAERHNDKNMLAELYEFVKRVLRYDPNAVQYINDQKKILPDEKTALDIYLRDAIGAARHQVLLMAYLVERLKKSELLEGCGSIGHTRLESGELLETFFYTGRRGTIYRFLPSKQGDGDAAAPPHG